MRQPYRKRRIDRPPEFVNFKPSGVPRNFLESVALTLDEFEALRLADYLGLEHLEASERMNISRPTFTRLIEKARTKLARVIVEGKELIIEGGNIDFAYTLQHCRDCGETIEEPFHEEVSDCPECGSSNRENLARPAGRSGHGGRRRGR